MEIKIEFCERLKIKLSVRNFNMETVFASIITIGDELLIGQVIDTNSSFIAQKLNAIGLAVKNRIAVGDDYDDIVEALELTGRQSRVVFITGGLGPTKDDITKEALCRYFGARLILNEEALENVRTRFETLYKRPMSGANANQAMVPDVCEVLQNARGTAPGMVFQKNDVTYVSMPGVPYEMEGMLEEVLPVLRRRFALPALIHKNILTSGIGESALAEHIAAFEAALPPQIRLAYLPSFGMVRLRLSCIQSAGMESQMETLHRQLVGECRDWIVSIHGETLEEAIGQLLREQGRTVSTAESCTGGAIAALLTSVPGSSDYFVGSIVSYSNDVKLRLLGVEADVLQSDGAVSERVVQQMVAGALKQMQTDYAVAVSGVMGPAGGTVEKPVGTVWMAAGNQYTTVTKKVQLHYTRSRNIETTRTIALNLLRGLIVQDKGARF